MPTYDYHCDKCGNTQEEFHSMNSTPEITCLCGEKMKKMFSPPTTFILKGDGWPSKEMSFKREMTNKNNKMSGKMTDRERSGEAVTSMNDLKKTSI